MIQLHQFSQKSYTEKQSFLTGIISQLEPKHIFADIKDFLELIKKPSEKTLEYIFELLQELLSISQEKDEQKKQEKIAQVWEALKKIQELEMQEGKDEKKDLEDLLDWLD